MRAWRLAWAAAVTAYAVLALWMLRQPVTLPSDDALFFARGLEHFSVLEFSPHFPGYPGFIALGRLMLLLTGDADTALFLVSTLSALTLPPVCAWVAWRWGKPPLQAFAVALTQPLLPALGLELLSDSSGLLFFLLALGARSGLGRGLLLGVALCCRPSYAVMILAALASMAWSKRRHATAMLAGFTLVCALGFGAVLAWEGWPYVDEGLRFLAGHTSQWGNTAFAGSGGPAGWMAAAWVTPLLLVPLPLGLAALPRAPRAASAALIAGLAWTVFMQNPDNLRHAAPVLILGGVMAAPFHRWAGLCMVTTNALVLLAHTQWPAAPPPLALTAQMLRTAPPALVITNHGVALLRRDLPNQRIMDAYWRADADFAAHTASTAVFRLTATAPSPGRTPDFAGRFLGERPLWLDQDSDQSPDALTMSTTAPPPDAWKWLLAPDQARLRF